MVCLGFEHRAADKTTELWRPPKQRHLKVLSVFKIVHWLYLFAIGIFGSLSCYGKEIIKGNIIYEEEGTIQ